MATLSEISKVSQDTADLSKRLNDWLKEGEKLKSEVGKINSRLLELFRETVGKKQPTNELGGSDAGKSQS